MNAGYTIFSIRLLHEPHFVLMGHLCLDVMDVVLGDIYTLSCWGFSHGNSSTPTYKVLVPLGVAIYAVIFMGVTMREIPLLRGGGVTYGGDNH